MILDRPHTGSLPPCFAPRLGFRSPVNQPRRSHNIQDRHLRMTRRVLHRPSPPGPILPIRITIPILQRLIVDSQELGNQLLLDLRLGQSTRRASNDRQQNPQLPDQYALEANAIVVLHRVVLAPAVTAVLGQHAIPLHPTWIPHRAVRHMARQRHEEFLPRGLEHERASPQRDARQVCEGPIDGLLLFQADGVENDGFAGLIAAAEDPGEGGAGGRYVVFDFGLSGHDARCGAGFFDVFLCVIEETAEASPAAAPVPFLFICATFGGRATIDLAVGGFVAIATLLFDQGQAGAELGKEAGGDGVDLSFSGPGGPEDGALHVLAVELILAFPADALASLDMLPDCFRFRYEPYVLFQLEHVTA